MIDWCARQAGRLDFASWSTKESAQRAHFVPQTEPVTASFEFPAGQFVGFLRLTSTAQLQTWRSQLRRCEAKSLQRLAPRVQGWNHWNSGRSAEASKFRSEMKLFITMKLESEHWTSPIAKRNIWTKWTTSGFWRETGGLSRYVTPSVGGRRKCLPNSAGRAWRNPNEWSFPGRRNWWKRWIVQAKTYWWIGFQLKCAADCGTWRWNPKWNWQRWITGKRILKLSKVSGRKVNGCNERSVQRRLNASKWKLDSNSKNNFACEGLVWLPCSQLGSRMAVQVH